ncbi:MAG TPA: hypothetical protein VGM49_01430 [Candidatus Limnocylindrales bacterium]|jgi:hypothetical protein
MTGTTDPRPPGPDLPPDPAAYDSERATQARARGLAAPYIAGGLDPDIEGTRRRERRDRRLLVAMIVIIVLGGFVLGIIANMLGLTFLIGPS